MHKLITPKYKYTMYHTEEKELFVLLSCMSIYKYSDTLLSILCWKKSVIETLQKQNIPLTIPWQDDEGIYEFKVHIDSFNKLIAYNTYVKPEQYKITWLKNKEKKLGHKIYKHYSLLKNKH